MKEETLFTVREVAKLVKRSPEWVHHIIGFKSITPTKIVQRRGRPMFLFDMEKVSEFAKHVKTNPYSKIIAKKESKEQIHALEKEIRELKKQLQYKDLTFQIEKDLDNIVVKHGVNIPSLIKPDLISYILERETKNV